MAQGQGCCITFDDRCKAKAVFAQVETSGRCGVCTGSPQGPIRSFKPTDRQSEDAVQISSKKPEVPPPRVDISGALRVPSSPRYAAHARRGAVAER